MSQRFTLGSIALSTSPQHHAAGGQRDDDTPYRIIVLGDFGAGSRTRPRLGKPVRVDLDNLETVFAQFDARLELPMSGDSVALTPRGLADLHPDQLFQLPCFERFRNLRARLADADTFSAACQELHALVPDAVQPLPVAAPPGSAHHESDNDLIERLLGRPRVISPSPTEVPAVQALLREVVAPSLAKVSAAEQAAAIAALDGVMSERITDLLHHPLFQALESTWRGIDFMVRQLELDDSIELYLCDLPVDRMREWALNHSLGSAVAATFVQRGGCGLLLGLYSFGTSQEEAQVLGAVSEAAQTLGVPFVAAADSGMIDRLRLNQGGFSHEWQQLIESPTAKRIALVAPRFLLRLPYGQKSDPVESLALEEMSRAVASSYLWGNSALIAGVLLAQSFAQCGWEMQGDEVTEIFALPQHVYREEGEAKLTSCAECWLSDEEVERLSARGISVLVASRGSDSVRLGLQSLACGGAR